MKKIALLIVSMSLTVNAFAYQVTTKDTRVYEFVNGKENKEGVKYNNIYEVNEKEKTITLIDADQIYTILYKSDGNLTAIRVRPQGEEIIAFKNDGTYSLFMTTYIPAEIAGVHGHFEVLAFGSYTMKQEE